MYFNISHENLSARLGGKEVLPVSHKTYLGNFIGSDIFDRAITQSVCAFNQSSNHLIADFSMIRSWEPCCILTIAWVCMDVSYGTITADKSTILCCMAQSYKEIVQTSIQNS